MTAPVIKVDGNMAESLLEPFHTCCARLKQRLLHTIDTRIKKKVFTERRAMALHQQPKPKKSDHGVLKAAAWSSPWRTHPRSRSCIA